VSVAAGPRGGGSAVALATRGELPVPAVLPSARDWVGAPQGFQLALIRLTSKTEVNITVQKLHDRLTAWLPFDSIPRSTTPQCQGARGGGFIRRPGRPATPACNSGLSAIAGRSRPNTGADCQAPTAHCDQHRPPSPVPTQRLNFGPRGTMSAEGARCRQRRSSLSLAPHSHSPLAKPARRSHPRTRSALTFLRPGRCRLDHVVQRPCQTVVEFHFCEGA
jgi:hypothetical protein